MRKSDLIKILNKIEGDPVVGIDLFTNKGSEFWAIKNHCIHTNDGGQSLALTTCRLRSALSADRQLKVKIPGIDSVDCSVKSVLDRFTEKYDTSGIDNRDLVGMDVQDLLCNYVYKDICELLRLLDDMLRLFNKPFLTQKYGITCKE